MGGWMDTNIYIACRRQVVAFAPKVIKCAVGAIMNERRNGRRDCKTICTITMSVRG
jgi:hypothetical protein